MIIFGPDLVASTQIKKRVREIASAKAGGDKRGPKGGRRKGRGNNDSACRNTYEEKEKILVNHI